MSRKLKSLAFAIAALTSLCVNAANYMGAQTNLLKGQQITSKNGRYILLMQHDGNLVLYFKGMDGGMSYLGFSTGTGGEYASMQHDGNLAVYNPNGTWRWQAGTGGRPISSGFKLTLTNEGSLDIRDGGNTVIKNLYTDTCKGNHPQAYYDAYKAVYTPPLSSPTSVIPTGVWASCGAHAKSVALQQGVSLNNPLDYTPYAF